MPELSENNRVCAYGRAGYGRCDVWLLLADSGGINVWCAAGGNYLTAVYLLTPWFVGW